MGWLYSSFQYVPFLIGSCVLAGFALWGWRRSGATGALLIAIAAGVRVLHELFGVYSMYRMWYREPRAAALQWMTIYGVVQTMGGLIAQVLLIVGVALLLRRLPAKAPRP
jgi:hypothetical protein